MLRELRDEGVLPFKYVVADCLYGNGPEFLQAIEACPGLLYVVSMPSDTRCWLEGPVMAAKHHNYQGAVRSTRVIAQKAKPPMTFAAVAHRLHDGFGYRRHVAEGTQGPLV